jgi:nitroreductase
MEEVKKGLLAAIRARRSTRSYRADPLPDALLEEILQAGRMAPSGSNNQFTHFMAITSREKLDGLRAVVTDELAGMAEREGLPPTLPGLIKRARQGPIDVTYGAPALVLTANRKGYYNALADSACALQNMMLTAAANEIGCCWINQYRQLAEAPFLRAYLEKLGLHENEEICGALALGYADKLESNPLPRTGNPVTYVR